MPNYEQLIGEPHTRLGEMIEATPACLKIIDSKGRLLTMNPTGLGMIGARSLDDVSGKDIYSLIEPSDRETFIEFNRMICQGERGELKFELIALDGTRRWMETWAAPYRLTNGEFAHIAITNDVTEKQKSNETIDQQRHALEIASRLSALGELAAGIAHEINNPLSIISGHAGLLRHQLAEGNLDMESLDQRLSQIEQTVTRISKITDSLRTFSSNVPPDMKEHCAIGNLIEETLSLCSEKFRSSGISVKVTAKPGLIVEINRVQISQVLMNLLTNSFHAIRNLEDKWIRIDASRRGQNLRIEFLDSGPGIDQDVALNMMTPFFTTKHPGEGTGLGLSISLGILRAHNGTLRYEPSLDNTRFIIELPITSKTT